MCNSAGIKCTIYEDDAYYPWFYPGIWNSVYGTKESVRFSSGAESSIFATGLDPSRTRDFWSMRSMVDSGVPVGEHSNRHSNTTGSMRLWTRDAILSPVPPQEASFSFANQSSHNGNLSTSPHCSRSGENSEWDCDRVMQRTGTG